MSKLLSKTAWFTGGRSLSRRRTMSKPLAYVGLAFLLVGVAIYVIMPKTQINVSHQASVLGQTQVSPLDGMFQVKTRQYDELRAGENLFAALGRLAVPPKQAEALVRAISREVNLRALRPGDGIMLESAPHAKSLNEPAGLAESSFDAHALELFTRDETGASYSVWVSIDFTKDGATAEVLVNRPVAHIEHQMISGEVSGSLYASIVNQGGNAQLVNSFADIFGWQFDFFRDTREGDRFQMIVEKKIIDGRIAGYGQVLAAEYSKGTELLRGFYFESKDGQVSGYFDQSGQSLKNAFLKSPVKLASITSGFNKHRFHPIQKRVKPHNGVDYGSPSGTPFMAVAEGRVINAGYGRFNGNWVRIKHNNGYETEYLHASKLAAGIRVGKRVTQGQVIGYVGKTGLASGNHLHFGMKKNGSYVNPSSQKFARNSGVPASHLSEFKRKVEVMAFAFTAQGKKNNTVAALVHDKPAPTDG